MHQGLFYEEKTMSTETKKKYSVKVTEVYTHHFEVEAGSEEDAREMATLLFLNEETDHHYDHDFVIEDEDVLLLEDEPATNVVDACG